MCNTDTMRSPCLSVILVIGALVAQQQVAHAAFVPTTTGGSSHHRPFRIAPGTEAATLPPPRPTRSTTSLQVVADPPEKDKLQKNKRNRGDDDNGEEGAGKSWIPTADGGFLPNLKRRLARKTEEKPMVMEVKSLEDYKAVVADEREQMVAVRFYAPWCRACRAVQNRFMKLATQHPGVKFVEVPLTESNAFLHEGLGIPSLPFAHIYHPDAGLVDERSINKKIFSEFKEVLQTYVDGECPIDWEDGADGE